MSTMDWGSTNNPPISTCDRTDNSIEYTVHDDKLESSWREPSVDQQRLAKDEDRIPMRSYYGAPHYAGLPDGATRSLDEHPPISIRRWSFAGISSLWIAEAVASVFGILCIGVIIVVLLYENNKPLDNWSLAVSPNAVVSFIATLAKSSSILVLGKALGQLRWYYFALRSQRLRDLDLLDDASRGPLGALTLVAKKGQNFILASVASVILAVAMLFTEPFVQLVLNFRTRQVATTQQIASLKIATAYNASSTLIGTQAADTAYAQNAPFQIQSALLAAGFGLTTPFSLECPTSNCTFPSFTTLGVCSACENVTSFADTICGSTDTGRQCITNAPPQVLPSVHPRSNKTGAGYQPPGPVTFKYNMSTDYMDVYTVWQTTSYGILPWDQSTSVPVGEYAIFAAFTALRPVANTYTSGSRPLYAPQVHHCRLSYCLRSYDFVEVTNGETNQGPVRTVPLVYSGNPYTWLGPYIGSGVNNYQTVLTMRGFVDGKMIGSNYSMNYDDYLNIGQYMQDIFYTSVMVSEQALIPGPGGKMAPSIGLGLYNENNITAKMENIANSLTTSMRTSQFNNTAINGTVLTNQTYIHIEWRWLSLPILIALLSPLLLITISIRSYARGIPPWKSSSLPLLFYSLEGWDESKIAFSNLNDLNRNAHSMRGRLIFDTDQRILLRDRHS